MAKPRVFISSTFFDLRQIREDLERLIKELGYEPIRHESGSVPYGKDDAPEAYAYKELELCDMIVCVIGGRFGTESQYNEGFSITQSELKKALERGTQVFIFIEKNVAAEFSTYKANKGNDTIKYSYVDNIKIYEFIEQIYKLPKNNPIATFEVSADITVYLRLQWAGLFQRYLQEQKRVSELRVIEELKSIAVTLGDLVNFMTEERKNKDDAIKNILMINHPAFRRFAEVTKTPYRVLFTTKDELSIWLRQRGWKRFESELGRDEEDFEEWGNENLQKQLSFWEGVFDEDEKLKVLTDREWKDDWVRVSDRVFSSPSHETPSQPTPHRGYNLPPSRSTSPQPPPPPFRRAVAEPEQVANADDDEDIPF